MENNLPVQIIETEDGSHSLRLLNIQEGYHSVHGALSESQHVFIKNGLKALPVSQTALNILEIGFGTGLNAFLSLAETATTQQTVFYETLEVNPVEQAIYKQLNYPQLIAPQYQDLFLRLHECEWGTKQPITPSFSIRKHCVKAEEFPFPENYYHLVYFDAFAPQFQPELWTADLFTKIYHAMQQGGILTTYCCKGDVKRALKAAGFAIEKLPGPKGKREILRARKG